jgi:DNA polymerase III alpha subunit (gram-positive type)
MNERNYIVIDLETTGLDPEQQDIVQISAKAINASNFEDHPSGHKTWLVKPTNPAAASEEAIRVIGKDLFDKACKDGLNIKVVLEDLVRWVNSVNDSKKRMGNPYFVGHNSKFDWDWLRTTMLRHKVCKTKEDLDKSWPFHVNFIDTATLMFVLFESNREVNNYKLDTLLNILGESRTTANHDAEEDVSLTAKAFVRFMKLFRQVNKKMSISKS